MKGLVLGGHRTTAITVALALTAFTNLAKPQASLEKIKIEYDTANAELQKHLIDGRWIDDDPQSPKLLTGLWQIAAAWVAAWLDERPSSTTGNLKAAIGVLASSETPDCLALDDNSFLVVAPGPIGNVFIVARAGDHYRLAWNTAQLQKSSGKQAELLAAWRAENARHGERGPYWAASAEGRSRDTPFRKPSQGWARTPSILY